MLEKFGMRSNAIRILKGLHEQTSYEVRGKEENSSKWKPQRGLREGCATSPVMFNIYHATSMGIANNHRKKNQREPVGWPWQWVPGWSLPPVDTRKPVGTEPRKKCTCLKYCLQTIARLLEDRTRTRRRKRSSDGDLESFWRKVPPWQRGTPPSRRTKRHQNLGIAHRQRHGRKNETSKIRVLCSEAAEEVKN